MNKVYTVRAEAPSNYVVIDPSTGAFVNRFHIPGTIVTGPIVSNDSCTIITRSGNTNTGYVIKLPTGHLINRFQA